MKHRIFLVGCLLLMWLLTGCGRSEGPPSSAATLPEIGPDIVPSGERPEPDAREESPEPPETESITAEPTEAPETEMIPSEPPVTEPEPGTEPSETSAAPPSETEPETEPAATETPVTEPAATEPPVTEPPATEPAPATGRLICIDPGHQGKGNYDTEPVRPGSSEMKPKVADGTSGINTGIRESVVNLTVGLKLRDELLSRGYRVIMTRESEDVDISNIERARIANEAGADAFLRLHCDSSVRTDFNGISIICQGNTVPENAAVYPESFRLSNLLIESMCAATGADNNGVYLQDNMTGINWSLVPGCLIEMGYLSNPEEEQKLLSEWYQDLLVKSMADALDKFFEE